MRNKNKYATHLYGNELYNYVLKHSDKDFKYIRKEMVNGKMRYYYEEPGSKIGLVKKPKDDSNKQYDLSFVGPVKSGQTKQYTQGPDIYTTKADRAKRSGNKTPEQSNNKIQTTTTNTHSGSGKSFTDNYDPKAPIDNTKFESIKDLPKQDVKLPVNENQNRVNPDFDRTKPDYSTNCAYCTATMDLRRRGYDVEANPHVAGEYFTNETAMCAWYKNTSPSDFVETTELLLVKNILGKNITNDEAAEALSKSMLKQGNGSYGQFIVVWENGSSHSVEWSVDRGEVYIRDTQMNKTSTFAEWYEKHEKYLSPNGRYSMKYLRTDNREISDEILKTCRPRRGLS